MLIRKVLSGHLLSIDTFYSIKWFYLRTAKALKASAQSDLDLRCSHMPEDTFSLGVALFKGTE